MKRPNFIFITSDQQRGDCYGFMGRKVKTPHLDQLRREGMHLRNCISPSPVCQPARAAILTGKLPKTNGVKDNGIDLRRDRGELGFASALSNAGYDTSLIGKAHFTRREGNAVVLQYKKDWCVLDIFFYGHEGQQESTYYEFRSREKTDMNISECINKMVRN